MLKLHCCLLLLFSFVGVSLCTNPGAKMRATQSLLDYIKTIGTEILRDMLRNEPLPDITGSTRMFGEVDYAITGVQVDEFNFKKSSATPLVGTDIDVSINDASATAHGNWKVKHWFIGTKTGGFSLSLSGVDIMATITTFKDESDRPAVLLANCHSHIKGAEIKFSGTLSWLYNLFSSYLEKPICNNLSVKLCPRIAEALKRLQNVLASFVGAFIKYTTLDVLHVLWCLKTKFLLVHNLITNDRATAIASLARKGASSLVKAPIDAYAEVDYFLINPPVSTMKHIDLDLKGTVHPVGNSLEFNFPLKSISMQEDAEHMLLIGLSEYFFNAVGFTFYTTDVLQQIITDEEFPNTPWLKTSDYNDQIPEMRNQYPISRPLMIKVLATKVPVVTVSPGALQLELFGVFEALAVLPDSTTRPVFSLNLEVDLVTRELWLSDFNLIGSFQLNRYQITSHSSNIGVFNDAALEEPVNFMLNSVVLPNLNEALRKGIPSPSLGNITFINTEVSIYQSSVLVSTDLFYIPWNKSLKNQSPTS